MLGCSENHFRTCFLGTKVSPTRFLKHVLKHWWLLLPEISFVSAPSPLCLRSWYHPSISRKMNTDCTPPHICSRIWLLVIATILIKNCWTNSTHRQTDTTHTHTQAHTHTHIQYIHTNTHKHTHKHTMIWSHFSNFWGKSLSALHQYFL